MNPKANKQPPNPAAFMGAPNLRVPNNPKNLTSFGPSTGAITNQNMSALGFKTLYEDEGMVLHPDVKPEVTAAQQNVIATRGINGLVGAPRPFDPRVGDTAGTQLPIGFPDGGPLAKITQRGMSTSPSMMPGAGPRRNEPPPRLA